MKYVAEDYSVRKLGPTIKREFLRIITLSLTVITLEYYIGKNETVLINSSR